MNTNKINRKPLIQGYFPHAIVRCFYVPKSNFPIFNIFKQRGSENTYLLRTSERHQYIRMLSVDSDTNMSRPFSYVKHLNFLDMTELNYTNPIYANFVRDPVERIISWQVSVTISGFT